MAIVSAYPPAVSPHLAAALCSGADAERPGPVVSGARRGRGVRPLKARFRATAGLVEDRELTERRSCPKKAAVLASVLGEPAGSDWCASLSIADARTEEARNASDQGLPSPSDAGRCSDESTFELLSCLRKEKESGKLSPIVASKMEEVYQNYRDAVMGSGNRQARDLIVSNMALAFDRVLVDVKNPFQFPPYHKAVRKPFDYYKFGQDYIRPLLDFRTSYVGNIHIFSEMEEKLKKGHNVVLISNHQTEADPAIIGLLLESTHPYIAEKLIYVAGDRVVTDPVCKPFSMGRNLICVNSKKHMNDDPNLIEKKKRENSQSLKEMATIFRKGSQILWIAPSGGRDRAEPSTGEWYPAPFDLSSVDIMRRIRSHSGVPGHTYPIALLCYEIMPPPPQVEKQIGEQRLISYHGVGLSVAPEIKYEETVSGIENPEQAKRSYSEALYNSVVEQYSILNSAIYGRKGLEASTSTVTLSQPWR